MWFILFCLLIICRSYVGPILAKRLWYMLTLCSTSEVFGQSISLTITPSKPKPRSQIWRIFVTFCTLWIYISTKMLLKRLMFAGYKQHYKQHYSQIIPVWWRSLCQNPWKHLQNLYKECLNDALFIFYWKCTQKSKIWRFFCYKVEPCPYEQNVTYFQQM